MAKRMRDPGDELMEGVNAALLLTHSPFRELLQEIVERGPVPASRFSDRTDKLQVLLKAGHFVENEGLLSLGPSVEHEVAHGDHRFEIRFMKSSVTIEYPANPQ